MDFADGHIEGVKSQSIFLHVDDRGWLAELFRIDQLDAAEHPAMSYLSVTLPGVTRGPHEHVHQTDLFCWVGPGDFKVTLWDNRPDSPTFGNRMECLFGSSNPGSLIVPPGVVHCYRCISQEAGWVFNAPNRLYAGEQRRSAVDEVRHESASDNPFRLDEESRRAVRL